MKLNRFAALAYVLAAAGAVHAQDLVATANIPFDFTVFGQTMHAGKYVISESYRTGRISLRGVDRKASAIGVAMTLAPAGFKEQGRVEFRRYGNQYVFRGVCIPGSYHGEVAVSAREREMAARVKPVSESVLANR